MNRGRTVWKSSSLLVGCIVQLLWGSTNTVPLYINALKSQYNYTQTTVEMLPSAIAVGRSLILLPALVSQKYGPAPTFVAGLTLGSGGYFLLWSSAFNKTFYQEYPAVMAFYFFLIGHGGAHMYLGVLVVVTRNFSGQHQGTAVSLVESCYGATPLCLLIIYRLCFSGGIHRDDLHQHLTRFLLFKGISTACCAMACLCFVRPTYSDEEEWTSLSNHKCENNTQHTQTRGISETSLNRVSTESSPLNDGGSATEQTNEISEEDIRADKSYLRSVLFVLRPFSSWPYQFLFWSFCITNAVSLGLGMNLSVYTKSVGLYSALDGAVIAFNATLSVSRLVIGPISDKLQNTVPRLAYTTVLSFIATTTFVAATLVPGTRVIILMITVNVGIYYGVAKPMTIAVVAKEMDERYFATYWALFQFMSCVMLLLWQILVSSLYESMKSSGPGSECFGDDCFRWIFLVAAISCLVTTVFYGSLAVLKQY